jgi:hypothetical protein
MNTDTTNIHDLPLDPAGGGTSGVTFSANEIPVQPHAQMQSQGQGQNGGIPNGVSLDQNTINQIISCIQQAGNVTQLPSRDIPMNTNTLTQDPSIQPNYIPPTSNQDYISNYPENDEIIDDYYKNSKRTGTLDEIYDQLQTPLLLAVLYFLFQLPVIKKALFKYLPFLFSADGNSNIQGLIFMSISYGLVYYITSKIMTNFNRF